MQATLLAVAVALLCVSIGLCVATGRTLASVGLEAHIALSRPERDCVGAHAVRTYAVTVDIAATTKLLQEEGQPPPVTGEFALCRDSLTGDLISRQVSTAGATCWMTMVRNAAGWQLHDDVLQGRVRNLAVSGCVLRAWAHDGCTLVLGYPPWFKAPAGSSYSPLAVLPPLSCDASASSWSDLTTSLQDARSSQLALYVWAF